ALDVTIQSQTLDLLASLQGSLGLAIILITHDLGVIARMCDRVAVMYGGRIVEEGATAALFERPLHPYTVGLLRSTPPHPPPPFFLNRPPSDPKARRPESLMWPPGGRAS